MISFTHYIKYTAACLLIMALGACTSEDMPLSYDERTATLSLIPQLQVETRAVGTSEENAIHTLRVIITDTKHETYINKSFTDEQVASGDIIIENVPVGTVEMYVIANEGALNKDYSDFNAWKNDMVDVGNEYKKLLIKDENRQYFPMRGIPEFANSQSGLPMSWSSHSLVVNPSANGTPQKVTVNLQRAVAKLNITMNNALTTPITISSMSFGAFFGDQLYLFQETSLDVPTDANYAVQTYDNLAIEIPGGEYKTLALYVYPSFAWKDGTQTSPYTLGFKTKAGVTYREQAFVNNYGALNHITRNTQVNIHATLSKAANVSIDFKVVPWTNNVVDVPFFE